MPMSKIEGGLFAVPSFGGTGRLMDMWNSNNIYFVDAVSGVSSNSGKDPEIPKALPSEAISACEAGASIYIKPYLWDQSVSSSDLWYTDDIIIPYNKSGIALIGCGEKHPFNYSGVGLKASTDGGTLINIKSNAVLLENLYLTLSGSTADQAAEGTPQEIVRSVRNVDSGSESRSYGGTIRGCRISLDKSHGALAGTIYGGAVALGCARQFLIEDNVFVDCLAGILMFSVVGSQTDVIIRNNQFCGVPGNRGMDIGISINNADCNSFVIRDNCFGDGLPDHTGTAKRFIYMTDYTAGTGIIANNYFATKTNIGSTGWETTGTQCTIADTMFGCHNFGESITTVSGELSISS